MYDGAVNALIDGTKNSNGNSPAPSRGVQKDALYPFLLTFFPFLSMM
jgi:hypothetical protein